MIYLNKLNAKLKALGSIEPDYLMKNRVYIPFLGSKYTKAQLAAWIKKRTDLLEDVRNKNYTDQQITALVTNVYNGLSADDKLIADKILADQPYDLTPSDADNYNRLVLIILYKFVTTP